MRFFSDRLSVRVANGDAESNEDYVGKEETTCREVGAIPLTRKGEPKAKKQGKRNDLNDIWDMVKSGKSEYDIAMAFPGSYARYHSGIAKFKDLHDGRVDVTDRRDIDVRVLWGEPGCGKSRWCREYAKSKGYTVCSNIDKNNSGLMSFEKYDGEVSRLTDFIVIFFSYF